MKDHHFLVICDCLKKNRTIYKRIYLRTVIGNHSYVTSQHSAVVDDLQ